MDLVYSVLSLLRSLPVYKLQPDEAFLRRGGAQERPNSIKGCKRSKGTEAYSDYGQKANVVAQELSKKEEVTVGLFLVELLNFFFHLSQLRECP